MNDFELSHEAYDQLHPRSANARRRGRELRAAIAPALRSLWKKTWPALAAALVFAMWAVVAKWDTEAAASAPHYRPAIMEVRR